MDILLFVLGLVLLVGLVVLHEFGHAIAARRNGVVVEEFGIGFPPKAWGRKLKNGTLFTLNWLPIGGFVKLKGEHDSAQGPGTYGGATLWVKTKILLAGVLVNWVTAIIIFSILALVGMPKILPNQFAVAGDNHVTQGVVGVYEVVEGSPAAKAGLQNDDIIVRLAGGEVTSAAEFPALTQKHAGQTVDLEYKRGDETKFTSVTLNKDRAAGQGFLGITPSQESPTIQRATWSAPIVGAAATIQFTAETFKGLGTTVANLFTAKFQEAGANVAGPVGIITIMKDSSTAGIVPVLFLLGIISLTLAVMNVLPIPALDGGRLFVTLLFRAFNKPLTEKREEAIQATGFLVLMLLVIVITVVDVQRTFF
ncbi:MAG TPA: M50 family metallopeptidase [Candidatus Saccharimonadales bacterium]|nr:M50 family metallopeptidase [Candidatus Saccharimonadales bacterium]